MTADDASSPPIVSIRNDPMSLSVNHSTTVLTMNGMNRNSRPNVNSAGTNSTALMSHARKKLSSENTIATTIAEPMLLIFTDGRKRASRRTVAVIAARCRMVCMARSLAGDPWIAGRRVCRDAIRGAPETAPAKKPFPHGIFPARR